MTGMPPHLRDVPNDELWRQFRRNKGDLWRVWIEDADNGLLPSMLEAADVIDSIESVGGTIHINLDVELPGDVDPLDDEQRVMLRENGEMVRELLRFQRECDYNLRTVADT